MAYSDYGAFVYKNDERRPDKEDVALFATDEETFGESSENIPSGLRIFVSTLHQREANGDNSSWTTRIHHGIMGDGNIRVMCHKQGRPQIFELNDSGEINEVEYCDIDTDLYEYGTITFEYKGYSFKFIEGSPYEAQMIEPDGTAWHCFYDYGYGAGFEE